GKQVAVYHDNRFGDLCIEAAKGKDGKDVILHLDFPECATDVKVWIAEAGHIRLVLLDTDLPQNCDACRVITNQLYGGGIENRIKQEIVLGIGGVRALRKLDITPTVWHANEGHAAFIVLERARELVSGQGLSFEVALEIVRASTVFTTHTPVPAGHDIFPLDLFDRHMSGFAEMLGISLAQLHQLGHGDFGHGAHGFNQTALAIHGAAYVNGVAKLHGEVSSVICQSMWPGLKPEENPVTSVTNGVHVATWLAPEWLNAFNQHLGGQWRGHLLDAEYWENIQDIPDYLYWSIHQTNKQRMLQYVREHLERQARRNGDSAHLTQAMTSFFDVRTLVVGFARRFATYKRATLLFQDEERLLELLNNTKRPVVFLFAGKAHPADNPGQELIRRIHEIARKPGFVGRILMLEGYDMTLGRYLTSGVDVWLNNPIRPMEASGTSGMKAAMNGVPNLSILDGWWPEGFQGDNGWAIGGERDIDDDEQRNVDDAASLYHLIQREVLPTYYHRNESGFSDEWVGISKRAMISSIPHFNTDRMVAEYTERFYVPASEHGRLLSADEFKHAKDLAAWKGKIHKSWNKISLSTLGSSDVEFDTSFGKELELGVQVNLDGLSADDIKVEVMLLRPTRDGGFKPYRVVTMEHVKNGEYKVNLMPDDSGDFAYHVRAYPTHPDLAHPLTMGL
ncbi:MAG: alpha-glucan family phosphorylase, partial [Mariprofundaceae bacterium]|nr:alpha-glucan family phosphorylase [Mariprofundaceae bacterium]